MAHIEGQVDLFLQTDGNRVTAVRLHSSRPVEACRVLIGQTVHEVPRIVSLLYRVCGHAQMLAALEACESARSIQVPMHISINRECMVLIETVREHAWRFLMDWPLLMEQKPALEAFQSIQRGLATLSKRLCPEGCCWRSSGEYRYSEPAELLPLLTELEHLLKQEIAGGKGHRITDWESRPDGGIVARLLKFIETQNLQAAGASDVALLPPLALAELEPPLAGDESGEFVARPRWQGHVYETGPIVRMAAHPVLASVMASHGRGLLVRALARLLELVELPEQIRDRLTSIPFTRSVEALSPAPGIGLSSVETARGRLIHRVELNGERIQRYQVLAPTEWNFHPEGPLVRGLHGLRAETPKALKRLVNMNIVALDPCVGYQVQID